MTGPQEPDRHLGLERLGDLDEGLLSPQEATAARTHLAGCALCQDDLTALSAVRAALAGDTELAMPDDIADRLHSALSALPPLDPAAAAPDDGLRVAAPAVTMLPAQRPRSAGQQWRIRGLVALGAAAVIALLVVGGLHLPSSQNSAATSAAAPAPAPVVPVHHSGANYTRTGLGAQALSLLAGAATSSQSTGAGAVRPAVGVSQAASAASAPSPSTAPSAAPSAAPLASAAESAAAAGSSAVNGPDSSTSAGTTTAPSAAAPSLDVLAALRQPGAALSCLEHFRPHSGLPLALDFASYQGEPAVIGVFQDPTDVSRLQVIAVGPPGCSLKDFVPIAKP